MYSRAINMGARVISSPRNNLIELQSQRDRLERELAVASETRGRTHRLLQQRHKELTTLDEQMSKPFTDDRPIAEFAILLIERPAIERCINDLGQQLAQEQKAVTEVEQKLAAVRREIEAIEYRHVPPEPEPKPVVAREYRPSGSADLERIAELAGLVGVNGKEAAAAFKLVVYSEACGQIDRQSAGETIELFNRLPNLLARLQAEISQSRPSSLTATQHTMVEDLLTEIQKLTAYTGLFEQVANATSATRFMQDGHRAHRLFNSVIEMIRKMQALLNTARIKDSIDK